GFLAAALLALGEAEAVAALCHEAIRLAEEAEDSFPQGYALRTLAETLLRTDPGRRLEGERLMRQAIDVLQDLGTRPELARTYVSYARYLLAAGERERALQLLDTAAAMSREMGMARHLTEIERIKGQMR